MCFLGLAPKAFLHSSHPWWTPQTEEESRAKRGRVWFLSEVTGDCLTRNTPTRLNCTRKKNAYHVKSLRIKGLFVTVASVTHANSPAHQPAE